MPPETHWCQGMSSDSETQSVQKQELVLFSRPECHLCDVAAQMLEDEGIDFRKRDIETDIDLLSRYGTRIPVVYRPDTGAELGWPFTPQRLKKFMESPE